MAKLYKPGNYVIPEMVHAQYNSLSKLHAALDGREIDGWRISFRVRCTSARHRSHW